MRVHTYPFDVVVATDENADRLDSDFHGFPTICLVFFGAAVIVERACIDIRIPAKPDKFASSHFASHVELRVVLEEFFEVVDALRGLHRGDFFGKRL
jgi:hypothetical protein